MKINLPQIDEKDIKIEFDLSVKFDETENSTDKSADIAQFAAQYEVALAEMRKKSAKLFLPKNDNMVAKDAKEIIAEIPEIKVQPMQASATISSGGEMVKAYAKKPTPTSTLEKVIKFCIGDIKTSAPRGEDNILNL